MINDFPKQVVDKILYYQVEQGNPEDISIFNMNIEANAGEGGFSWEDTPEGYHFWWEIITNQNFEVFFNRYPEESPKHIVVAEDYITFFGTKVPIKMIISAIQIHKILVS